MTKAKYKVGDRIPGSPFIVRGVATLDSGEQHYFIQILEGGNTFVANTEQLERSIQLVQNKIINFRPN